MCKIKELQLLQVENSTHLYLIYSNIQITGENSYALVLTQPTLNQESQPNYKVKPNLVF